MHFLKLFSFNQCSGFFWYGPDPRIKNTGLPQDLDISLSGFQDAYKTMLRIWIPDPGSIRFPNPGSESAAASKRLSILTQKIVSGSRKWSGILIPDPGSESWFFTHPGFRIQGQKGTGSRIRNTATKKITVSVSSSFSTLQVKVLLFFCPLMEVSGSVQVQLITDPDSQDPQPYGSGTMVRISAERI